MNKKNISIIIIVIVVFIIAFMYLGRNNSNTGTSALSVQTTGTANNADAQYIYNLLQQMAAVKLDDSIFSRQDFQSLKDNTVTLTPQQAGRNNPFSPIGSDSGTVVRSAATSSK